MRVLHVIKGLGPGGAERLLVSLAGAQAGGPFHVAYLLPWKNHLLPELHDQGVTTHLLAGERGFTDPRWPWRLLRLVRRERIGIVHLHSPAVAAVARPVLRAAARTTIVVSTEHNVWSSYGRPTRWANALTLPLDHATFAVSSEVVRSARPGDARRMEVLTHGVPVAALAARRQERSDARVALGVADDDVLVVTVANLRRHKDFPTLFRAAALALAQESRLRFVAVGQGPLEPELRARLETFDLGDRFAMAGYHPDPARVLAAADVFTLASTHEGLPVSLLEAMALGVPPVVTAVGGVPEVITSAATGILVPPGEPEALARALVELARDPERRHHVGVAAASRAADFDIERAARELRGRYQALARPADDGT